MPKSFQIVINLIALFILSTALFSTSKVRCYTGSTLSISSELAVNSYADSVLTLSSEKSSVDSVVGAGTMEYLSVDIIKITTSPNDDFSSEQIEDTIIKGTTAYIYVKVSYGNKYIASVEDPANQPPFTLNALKVRGNYFAVNRDTTYNEIGYNQLNDDICGHSVVNCYRIYRYNWDTEDVNITTGLYFVIVSSLIKHETTNEIEPISDYELITVFDPNAPIDPDHDRPIFDRIPWLAVMAITNCYSYALNNPNMTGISFTQPGALNPGYDLPDDVFCADGLFDNPMSMKEVQDNFLEATRINDMADIALYGAIIDSYRRGQTFRPLIGDELNGNDLGPNEWVVRLVADPNNPDYHWIRQDFDTDGNFVGWSQKTSYGGLIVQCEDSDDYDARYTVHVGYYVVGR